MSNRGVVLCLDIEGFRDNENDGPVKDEKLTGQTDADVIWSFDMMEEVGSYPHNMSNSSPVDLGRPGLRRARRTARTRATSTSRRRARPSIIALNKNTGKLVWEDNSVEDRILHGQWSTPAVGTIGGVAAGGHRRRATAGCAATRRRPARSSGSSTPIPKDSVWPQTRNELIATPVIYEDRVYIANGQDPEHGEGVGHFYAIDATKRGDITQSGPRLALRQDPAVDLDRRRSPTAWSTSRTSAAILHCLDAKTGQEYWTHDMLAAVWGSPLVVDGKVYLGDEDGDVVVLAARERSEGARRDEHGQRRVRDVGPGAWHAVPQQPQPALRDRGEMITAKKPTSRATETQSTEHDCSSSPC